MIQTPELASKQEAQAEPTARGLLGLMTTEEEHVVNVRLRASGLGLHEPRPLMAHDP